MTCAIVSVFPSKGGGTSGIADALAEAVAEGVADGGALADGAALGVGLDDARALGAPEAAGALDEAVDGLSPQAARLMLKTTMGTMLRGIDMLALYAKRARTALFANVPRPLAARRRIFDPHDDASATGAEDQRPSPKRLPSPGR